MMESLAPRLSGHDGGWRDDGLHDYSFPLRLVREAKTHVQVIINDIMPQCCCR